MQIHTLTQRIKEETGILLSRSRLYHYDRMGLLGDVGREDNSYRKFDEKSYNRVKIIVLMTDVGIGLNEIKEVLENQVTMERLMNHLVVKQRNLQYLIEVLS